MSTLLGMFAKEPIPGRVKTRLAASIGAAPAADVYQAFVGDLIEKHGNTGDRRVLSYAPNTASAQAWATRVGGKNFEVSPQSSGDLGTRMQSFFDTAFTVGNDRVVLIGSDSPNLPVAIVEQAFESLLENDVVLGPAMDGGYYLVGQRVESRNIFEGIEWSSERVFEQNCERIESLNASLGVLPEWFDVDTAVEAHQLREQLLRSDDKTCPRTLTTLNSLFQDT